MDLSYIFTESFWAIAALLSTFVTGLINQGFKIGDGKVKRLVSWLIGAGAAVGAWAFNFITFEEPQWIGVVSLALVVCLSSNGIYEFKGLKKWINTWFVHTAEPEEVEEKK